MQTKIKQDDDGKVILIPAEAEIQRLWEDLYKKKREMKAAEKAYKKYRDSYKYHKTPVVSDAEE